MRRLMVMLGLVVGIGFVAGCGGGTPEQGSAPVAAPATGNVEITLTTQPDPPRMGETTFEAMVMQGGQPVTDANVTIELFMAAMPEVKMPEMRNTVALNHEGGGRYRGTGNVMMAGNWDATVSVKRGGQDLGTRKVAIVAK